MHLLEDWFRYAWLKVDQPVVSAKARKELYRKSASSLKQANKTLAKLATDMPQRLSRVIGLSDGPGLLPHHSVAQDLLESTMSQIETIEKALVSAGNNRSGLKADASRTSMKSHFATDLAEIYTELTGEPATRRSRSNKHANVGEQYGYFWNFALSCWMSVFETKMGLENALKGRKPKRLGWLAWYNERNGEKR